MLVEKFILHSTINMTLTIYTSVFKIVYRECCVIIILFEDCYFGVNNYLFHNYFIYYVIMCYFMNIEEIFFIIDNNFNFLFVMECVLLLQI